MGIFKKKPVDIEARRFETNNEAGGSPNMDALVQWINFNGGQSFHDGTAIQIQTLEGVHRADVGDWIIRGVKGEFYPCKPDIFAMTYVAVEATTPAAGPQPTYSNLSFGEALKYAKRGLLIQRAGWNGKGMFVYLFDGNLPADRPESDLIGGVRPILFQRGGAGTVLRMPNLNMKAADGATVTGWFASQTDMLAEDWQVIDGDGAVMARGNPADL